MQALGFALYPWLYPTFCGVYFTVATVDRVARVSRPDGAPDQLICASVLVLQSCLESFPHIRPCGPYSHTIGHISRQPNL